MKKAIILIMTIILAFSFFGCGEKKEKEEEQVAYVKIEAPVSKEFADKLSLPATLRAKDEASVNSNISSMVMTVNVRVGDQVSKGDTLAVLDSAVAARTYEKAKIGFQNVEKIYFRIKNLYDEGAISLMECDAAKANYDMVLEDYNLAKLNLDYTRITAPMSGVISAKNMEVGQMAAPGQEAFRIVDLSTLIAESGVSEKDITKLQYGQSVNINLQSGEQYMGKIDSISPVTNQMTSTYPISVLIDNPDGKLKAGMFADIEIIFGVNKNSIAIKNTGVINEDGIFSVFVNNNGIAEKRNVQIGIQDEEYTEILDGIKSSDKIICAGQDTLKDGDKVKVIKEN
ncbi:MAG TPA: efflux RND transporter periplasmic adaptor subunit [Anaerovoracaceae bacterium]|nr:efflux RND transporter periplasmic adaptor subunit [Anaerovoracaceae bacterium]